MCKSRCIANYKIKFHWSKMKYIRFYPMTSLATSLAKINCACVKFITTAFTTTISFSPLTFLGQIQSMKYCQRSKYFLFWNHIMKKKGGKKLIFSFSLFLIRLDVKYLIPGSQISFDNKRNFQYDLINCACISSEYNNHYKYFNLKCDQVL